MAIRKWRFVVLATLMLFLVLVLYGSSQSQGRDIYGDGCQCHNNGVGLQIDGTELSSEYDRVKFDVRPGGSFNLTVKSYPVTAFNVFPAQEWMLNQSHNADFIFNPQIVYDNSTWDLSQDTETITAIYMITAPLTLEGGTYYITLFAQGAYMSMTVTVSGTPIPEFYDPISTLTVSASAIVAVIIMKYTRRCAR